MTKKLKAKLEKLLRRRRSSRRLKWESWEELRELLIDEARARVRRDDGE